MLSRCPRRSDESLGGDAARPGARNRVARSDQVTRDEQYQPHCLRRLHCSIPGGAVALWAIVHLPPAIRLAISSAVGLELAGASALHIDDVRRALCAHAEAAGACNPPRRRPDVSCAWI